MAELFDDKIDENETSILKMNSNINNQKLMVEFVARIEIPLNQSVNSIDDINDEDIEKLLLSNDNFKFISLRQKYILNSY